MKRRLRRASELSEEFRRDPAYAALYELMIEADKELALARAVFRQMALGFEMGTMSRNTALAIIEEYDLAGEETLMEYLEREARETPEHELMDTPGGDHEHIADDDEG